MLWVGLAGSSAAQFATAGLDEFLDRQLRVEVSEFCRIPHARVRLIHDSVDAADPWVLATIWRTTNTIVEEFIHHAARSDSTTHTLPNIWTEDGQLAGGG
jgi:hypothetical protein